YTVYPSYVSEAGPEIDGVSRLVKCDHFDVCRVSVNGKKTINADYDSFATYTCIDGELTVTDDRGNSVSIRKGESVLIPAVASSVVLEGQGEFIQAIC
ncbi:MAG: hypothetical protein K2L46_05075, partial [Paramuribaculum sp.]|nr:hypothetical protein [Paramuribaculum sp.]